MGYILEFSCRREHLTHILSWEPSPAENLMRSIMREKCFRNPRVTFKNNKYRYFPTEDYKNYVIKFRGVRK